MSAGASFRDLPKDEPPVGIAIATGPELLSGGVGAVFGPRPLKSETSTGFTSPARQASASTASSLLLIAEFTFFLPRARFLPRLGDRRFSRAAFPVKRSHGLQDLSLSVDGAHHVLLRRPACWQDEVVAYVCRVMHRGCRG